MKDEQETLSGWEQFSVPWDAAKDPQYFYRYWDTIKKCWMGEQCPSRHPRYNIGQRILKVAVEEETKDEPNQEIKDWFKEYLSYET